MKPKIPPTKGTCGVILARGTEEQITYMMERYQCDRERVLRYNDLRDEGYQTYQALVMAGLTDPEYYMLLSQTGVIDMINSEIALRGINQSEYARRVGISRSHLSHILAGRKEPAPEILLNLGLERAVFYRSQLPKKKSW